MSRPVIWLDANEPDPHEQHVLARYMANAPSRRPKCTYCDKKAIRSDGCCNEHTEIEGCEDCGRDVSMPGRCFSCDIEQSYVGGLAPRYGAEA